MIRKISTQDVVSKRASEGEPTRRERDFLIEQLTRKHATVPPRPPRPTRRHKSSSGFKFNKKWVWFGLPLVLILILIVIMQFMVSATVTVVPKKADIQVNEQLVASLTASTSPTSVTYQVITLSASDEDTVVATGTVATKPQKASGQITVFNNYSTAAQTLVKNTRFETADGLIYRAQNTVVVPGSFGSGAKKTAGSVTVSVVADQVGSKYDIGLSDFTIPGFKTDVGRFTKIFARSKTTMTGGSDGSAFGVSDEVRQAARADIDARLVANLLQQVQAQKTPNSVIFDKASKIAFQHLPDTQGADSQHVLIREQGTISSVVFDKTVLGKLLLGNAIDTVGGNAEVHGLESLHFLPVVSSSTPTWQTKPFTFTLVGPVEVVGVVDTDKLTLSILGIPRSDLDKALSNFPTIDKATASIRPIWRGSFPSDASEINIEVSK